MGGGPTAAQLVKHWAPAHGNQDGHYYICIGTGKAGGTNQPPWLTTSRVVMVSSHGRRACPAWPCSACRLPPKFAACYLVYSAHPTPHHVKLHSHT